MSLSFKFLISLNVKKIFCVLYGERKMVLSCGKRRLLPYTGPEQCRFLVRRWGLRSSCPPHTRSIYCLDISQVQLSLLKLHLCSILYGTANIGYKFSSDTKVNFPSTHSFGFYLFFLYLSNCFPLIPKIHIFGRHCKFHSLI